MTTREHEKEIREEIRKLNREFNCFMKRKDIKRADQVQQKIQSLMKKLQNFSRD